MADTSSGTHFLVNAWYKKAVWLYLLWPISLLYRALVAARKLCYQWGVCKSWSAPIPVIVVGNITAGGTGKTPFVVSLVRALKAKGLHPAIVSRGYASDAPFYPFYVTPESSVQHAGDEPLLLAIRTNVPVIIGADRVQAVQSLLNQHTCDVIVCDDGLQHYALGRDIEVMVVDGQRMFGNGLCLPAGPLREPMGRSEHCDFIVANGSLSSPLATSVLTLAMQLQAVGFARVQHDEYAQLPVDLSRWGDSRHVHAVAGIGNPGRFFDTLRNMGFTVVEHIFDDHHLYSADDLRFAEDLPVIMTEKDAVKVRNLQSLDLQRFWYVPVDAVIDTTIFDRITAKVKDLLVS